MGAVEELRGRVEALEEKTDVVIDLINQFIGMVCDESFVGRIDKLVRHEEE